MQVWLGGDAQVARMARLQLAVRPRTPTTWRRSRRMGEWANGRMGGAGGGWLSAQRPRYTAAMLSHAAPCVPETRRWNPLAQPWPGGWQSWGRLCV